MNGALTVTACAAGEQPPALSIIALTMLDHVPPKHGVAVLAGFVVVYDETDRALEADQLYVIEHQRPPAGMHPETYHHQSLEYHRRREPNIQLTTERTTVRVARWHRDRDLWQYTRPDGFTEAPLYEWGLRTLVVGRVVGLYAPGERVRS